MAENRYQRNNNNNTPRRPSEVTEFMEMNYDDWKKQYKGSFYSKKEIRAEYVETMLGLLPATIEYVVRFGYRESEEEVKNRLHEVIFYTTILNAMTKYSENKEFRNDFILLPIILRDMVRQIVEVQKTSEPVTKEEKELEEERTAKYTQMIDLSKAILKKRIKKLVKKGLSEELAFDLASIVPVEEVMKYGTYFKLSEIFRVLYAYGNKEGEVPIESVMELIVDEYQIQAVDYALLERKDKYASMTDGQKKVFNDITAWVFHTLEEQDEDIIRKVLVKYVSTRKRDFQNGKDSARRFYLQSVPEGEFPRVAKCVKKMVAANDGSEKFL